MTRGEEEEEVPAVVVVATKTKVVVAVLGVGVADDAVLVKGTVVDNVEEAPEELEVAAAGNGLVVDPRRVVEVAPGVELEVGSGVDVEGAVVCCPRYAMHDRNPTLPVPSVKFRP